MSYGSNPCDCEVPDEELKHGDDELESDIKL